MPLKWILLKLVIQQFFNCGAIKVEKNAETKSLKIIGQQIHLPLEHFEGSELRFSQTEFCSMHLEFLHINPAGLLNCLNGVPALENLTLENVVWEGPFPTRISLRNLTRLRIKRLDWDFEFGSSAEIMSFLNFFQTEPEPFAISRMNASIYFETDLATSLTFRPSPPEFSAVGEPHSLFRYFRPTVLTLKGSAIDVEKFSGRGLLKLSLATSTLENGEMAELIEKCTDVTEIEMVDQGEFDVGKLKSPQLLRHLSLSEMHLTASKETHLSNLEYLMLKKTTMYGKFIHTSDVLRVAKAIHTDATAVALTEFLKQKPNLEYFQLWGFPSFDISTLLPSKAALRKLFFCQVHLTQSRPASFHNLTRLVLRNVSVSRSFVDSFPDTFNSVEYVDVGVRLDGEVWEAILKASAIRRIKLKDYHFYSTPRVDSFLLGAGCPLYHETIEVVKVGGVWKHLNRGKGIWYDTRVRDAFIYGLTLTLSAICIGGLIGNFFSGIVLSQRAMRTSTSCILIGLTICDTVVLVSYLPSILFFTAVLATYYLNFIIQPSQGYTFLGMRFTAEYAFSYFELHKSIFYPMSKTAFTGSVYATVLVTLERYVAISWPLKAKRWTSIQKSILCSLTVFLLAIAVNFPRWFEVRSSFLLRVGNWTEDGEIISSKGRFVKKVGSMLRTRWYMEYYQQAWIFLVYVLPITGLILLNFCIWRALRQSRNMRRRLSEERSRMHGEKDFSEVTNMLLTVTSIFLICSLTNAAVILTLISYGGEEPIYVEGFTCIPLIINSSVNFIIYTTKGRTFRAEFIKLVTRAFTSVRRRCRGTKSNVSTNQETTEMDMRTQ